MTDVNDPCYFPQFCLDFVQNSVKCKELKGNIALLEYLWNLEKNQIILAKNNITRFQNEKVEALTKSSETLAKAWSEYSQIEPKTEEFPQYYDKWLQNQEPFRLATKNLSDAEKDFSKAEKTHIETIRLLEKDKSLLEKESQIDWKLLEDAWKEFNGKNLIVVRKYCCDASLRGSKCNCHSIDHGY